MQILCQRTVLEPEKLRNAKCPQRDSGAQPGGWMPVAPNIQEPCFDRPSPCLTSVQIKNCQHLKLCRIHIKNQDSGTSIDKPEYLANFSISPHGTFAGSWAADAFRKGPCLSGDCCLLSMDLACAPEPYGFRACDSSLFLDGIQSRAMRRVNVLRLHKHTVHQKL